MKFALSPHILRLEGRAKHLLEKIEAREKIKEPVSYERAECSAILAVLSELRDLRGQVSVKLHPQDSSDRSAVSFEWPAKSSLELLLSEAKVRQVIAL